MSVLSKCPSAADLRQLLDSNRGDSDSGEIISHLCECSCCQQSLEAIATGDSGVAQSLQKQAAYSPPEPHSAYWAALKNAEIAVTMSSPASSKPRGELSLSFLDPPTDHSYLGSLENFHVVRVVGRGGMGLVLHAIDTCLQRDVAIKVLEPEFSKDENARERFCREARAAAAISHENVVAVHLVDHHEEKDLPYLVMELVNGESLEKKLERDGRLSLREIVSIGMQAAAGLAAAHEKGLIHRDIKPGNILLERTSQRVKLTDFGLARAAEDIHLTRSGLVAGTPMYMSPEQANGDELDARSDLFSLGVVLYELAAGVPPFSGKTPLAVLKGVTEAQPEPLQKRNPEMPEWFAHIVERLLAKKPADRFQSAREVATTLEHFWVLLKSSETVACPKKKAANQRKAIALGAGAGLLTLILGAVVFSLLPHRSSRNDTIPNPLHVFKGNGGALWSLAIAKNGASLATGNDNGTVQFWDIPAEKVAWTLNAHKTPVWGLALSPKGDLLATGSDDGQAILWDVETQNKIHTLTHPGGVRSLAFDSEGKKLVSGERTGAVRVWDVQTGTKLVEIPGHSGSVIAVAFAPDGKTVASGGGDRLIKIWDAITGGPKLTLTGHESGVYGIDFSPNGKRLVSGSWDRTVRLWDLDSGSQLAKLDGHTQDVWSVAFHPDATMFASGGEDQVVRIWSTDSMKELAAFRGSTATILNVRFSREPQLLVAGGKDGTARMWNLANLNFGR